MLKYDKKKGSKAKMATVKLTNIFGKSGVKVKVKVKGQGWLLWSKSIVKKLTFDKKKAKFWYRSLKLGSERGRNVQKSQNSIDDSWNEILGVYK